MKLLMFFIGIATSSFGAHLPPEIQICKKSDPNFNKCLISSFEKSLTVLADGYKDLGIPTLEPFYLQEIIVEPQPGPINIYQRYTDIILEGTSKAKIADFRINLDDCTIWGNYTVKHAKASSNYELKGQLLLLPVDAKGKATIYVDELVVLVRATCEKFKKNGKEYIRVLTIDLSSIVRHPRFDFGVLINGNPQLDQDLHKIIDDNPDDFFEIMRPTCESMFSIAFLEVFNSVFTHIPLEELFMN